MLGIMQGSSIGDIKADTGSLDYGSHDLLQGRFRQPGGTRFIKCLVLSGSTLNPKPSYGSFSRQMGDLSTWA